VAELLGLVHLTGSSDLRPRQVSGGMAQRAALARALARGPGVLLLDEPFGALDALTRLRMQDLLLDVHSAEPATIVLVTHDVDEALYLADRVVLLGADSANPDAGSGIVRTVGVPGSRPRDRGDAELARIRSELLAGLGVTSHHGAESAAPTASFTPSDPSTQQTLRTTA
jgi:sulfonate transport system ATP-binding protein